MKFRIIFLFLLIKVSNLFGQDCKFRISEIAIPIKPFDENKVKKKLCIYDFDTTYSINFHGKDILIQNKILTEKIISLKIKRKDINKTVNSVNYFSLDTSNLTKEKLLNYADLVIFDSVKSRYILLLKKLPLNNYVENNYNKNQTWPFEDENLIEIGQIEFKNEKWIFDMAEKYETILINEKDYTVDWKSPIIIILK